MYTIGYDIGSSSVKAALVDTSSGEKVSVVQYPEQELDMISHHPGWAEQHPETWWKCLCKATHRLIQISNIKPEFIQSIGIAYQMHGLVVVDKDHIVLRPAIIWCDSRAVEIGNQAFQTIGKEKCLSHLLNSPGNFTASKLKWVKDREPEIFSKIYKAMLPGDYIAMKLTGEICTTVSGLSEGVFWDFRNHSIADLVIGYYGIQGTMLPDIIDTFSFQGKLTSQAAKDTGLSPNTIVSYRAGDQPNSALSLGVFNPNDVAATGGTSGVVYGIVDKLLYDDLSRVNGFAHVNHDRDNIRIGQLLCINGAGIQYAWIKQQMADDNATYHDMEHMLSSIPVGADGLRIIPFGNGAERVLANANTGAQVNNLQFNRHTKAHFYRAALEGIAFSFVYGFKVLKGLGLDPEVIKVGNDNLFQSTVFSRTIANLLGCSIEVIATTGAVGAAKASGIGSGIYSGLTEAIGNHHVEFIYEPDIINGIYQRAYDAWENDLENLLRKVSDI